MRIGFDTNSVLLSHRSATTYLLELISELARQAEPNDQIVVLRADEEAPTLVAQFRRQESVRQIAAPFQKGAAGALWRKVGFPAVERLISSEAPGTLDVLHCWLAPTIPSAAPRTLLTIDRLEQDLRFSAAVRRSLSQATALVVPSRILRDELLRRLREAFPKKYEKKFGTLADRIEVINPGVNPRYRSPPKASAVEQLCEIQPALEEPYLLAIGGAAEPGDNLPSVLRAFAAARRETKLPRLAIVAQPENTETVLESLRDHELSECSTVLEAVPNEIMPALYRGASFLLYPALDFAFGIAVLEAAACSVPAIVGTGCGALEVLGDALFRADANDATAWAQAIVTLAGSPEECHRRAALARQRALSASWETAAELHWRLYRSR